MRSAVEDFEMHKAVATIGHARQRVIALEQALADLIAGVQLFETGAVGTDVKVLRVVLERAEKTLEER